MFKNSTMIMFYMTLIMSTFIVISSNSWLSAWIGLEINLLSFIPLMINKSNLMSAEASLKYFLTQALASSCLIFSVLLTMVNMNLISNMDMNFMNLMINSTLLLKMGAAPFHFWFPEVMEGLSWLNNGILMTWQKIAPMMLIYYCFSINFIIFIIIMSSLMGSLLGLNQTSLRKIMAYSSINHIGWLLAGILINQSTWMIYFLLYSFLSMTIVILFNFMQIFHINQTFSMKMSHPIMKFSIFSSFLSLGGLPPFLGFLPKWIIIQNLIMINQPLLVLMMVMLTLITLFFYLRISFSALMLNYNMSMWSMKMNYKNMNLLLNLSMAFISIFGLLMINLMYTVM
uniref:NADH-ubiquinone oxidoreductase chain 2 n=1 Tax=Paracladura trichoptera TaxID=1111055 RepID=G8J8J3_9DIPT|nr:NADH dehydrogenase subunit 2 [Paracladura trichoptera]AET13111.1 NADH dehydrogenase subunit 2 [Paracladura trichoptera]